MGFAQIYERKNELCGIFVSVILAAVATRRIAVVGRKTLRGISAARLRKRPTDAAAIIVARKRLRRQITAVATARLRKRPTGTAVIITALFR